VSKRLSLPLSGESSVRGSLTSSPAVQILLALLPVRENLSVSCEVRENREARSPSLHNFLWRRQILKVPLVEFGKSKTERFASPFSLGSSKSLSRWWSDTRSVSRPRTPLGYRGLDQGANLEPRIPGLPLTGKKSLPVLQGGATSCQDRNLRRSHRGDHSQWTTGHYPKGRDDL